jgi:pilus assembly protein CpaB
MNKRAIVLIVAALVVTGTTVFMVRNWLASQRTPQVVVEESRYVGDVFVLVARQDLPTGQFLEEGVVTWQAWPDESIPDTYFIQKEREPTDYFGAVIRRAISKGQPVTIGELAKPGDRGFLAAVLRPGYRAVAVPTNARTGVAGFVFPGDRVDVILSHTVVEKADKKATKHRVSETVLTNVRILAIDQKVDDQNSEPKIAKTATVEVTPKQAELLAVVQQLGSLSLSLRSLAKDEEELGILAAAGDMLEDPDPVRGETFTLDTQVSRVVVLKDNSKKPAVVVSRGSETQVVIFGKAVR